MRLLNREKVSIIWDNFKAVHQNMERLGFFFRELSAESGRVNSYANIKKWGYTIDDTIGDCVTSPQDWTVLNGTCSHNALLNTCDLKSLTRTNIAKNISPLISETFLAASLRSLHLTAWS